MYLALHIRDRFSGNPVQGLSVPLKRHSDDSTVQSQSSDASGFVEFRINGNIGDVYAVVEQGGERRIYSTRTAAPSGAFQVGEAGDFLSVIGPGVVEGLGQGMAVSPSGMGVSVGTGGVMLSVMQHRQYTAQTVTVPTAHPTNARIDLVVARSNVADRTSTLAVVQGAAAVSPVAPIPTQSASVWEEALATVLVDAGVATIVPGKVMDARRFATAKIVDGSIATAKLADNSVTTAKIPDNAVTTAKVNALAVTTAKIADANVTTAKIADANVTTAKVADAAITQAKHANNSVGTAQLIDANVTTAKLADLGVTGAKIAAATISEAKLDTALAAKVNTAGSGAADGSITTAKLADNSVTSAKIVNATITGTDIAATTITGSNIANATISESKLDAALVTKVNASGGGGDYNQTIEVYGPGIGFVTGNPRLLDFKEGFDITEPETDLVRIALAAPPMIRATPVIRDGTTLTPTTSTTGVVAMSTSITIPNDDYTYDVSAFGSLGFFNSANVWSGIELRVGSNVTGFIGGAGATYRNEALRLEVLDLPPGTHTVSVVIKTTSGTVSYDGGQVDAFAVPR